MFPTRVKKNHLSMVEKESLKTRQNFIISLQCTRKLKRLCNYVSTVSNSRESLMLNLISDTLLIQKIIFSYKVILL